MQERLYLRNSTLLSPSSSWTNEDNKEASLKMRGVIEHYLKIDYSLGSSELIASKNQSLH